MTDLSSLYRAAFGGNDNSPSTPAEGADTLVANEYVEITHLVGAGKLKGWVHPNTPELPNACLQDVYFNGTPAMNPDGTLNFEGVSVSAVWGTEDQTLDTGVDHVASSVVVGVEVRKDTPAVRQINDPRITDIVVQLGVNTFSSTDTSTGSVGGYTVDLAIDLASAGGEYRRMGYVTFDGKASSPFSRNYRIALPKDSAGPWRVRVVRLTDDTASAYINDTVIWQSYTKVVGYRFKYPLCAVITTRFPAKAFSSTPTIQFLLHRAETPVPSNYDPSTRTYAGLWDGTFKVAHHSNPAWVYWDLLTDPINGLGALVSESELQDLKWQLYEIGRYCDEPVSDGFGGTEPRFAFHDTLRDRQQALQVLTNLAGVFRGVSFTFGGQVHVVQDRPAEPELVFTNANVEEGVFSYSGTGASARHSVAYVGWKNPENNYEPEIEYIPLPWAIEKLGGVFDKNVVALGAISRGQAYRAGMYDLLVENLLDEVVTFKPGLDGALAVPGQVFVIRDRNRSTQRLGGRLLSAGTVQLELDSAVKISAGALARITVMLPDGTCATSEISTATAIDGRTIYLEEALPAMPARMAVWSISLETDEESLWRCLTVKSEAGKRHEVIALPYKPEIYEQADQAILQPVPAPNQVQAAAERRIGPVSSIDVHLEVVYVNPTTPINRLRVSWPAAAFAVGYTLRWRLAGGAWQMWSGPENLHDIDNVTDGTYQLEVISYNVLGQSATKARAYAVATAGLYPAPANVTGLVLSTDGTYVTARWDALPDLDVVGYEVRRGGTSWETATPVDTPAGTSLTIPDRLTGSVKVWVKARTQFGALSDSAAAAEITLGTPTIAGLTATLDGADCVLAWTAQKVSLAVASVEIRWGASWAAGTSLGVQTAATLRFPVTWAGARKFWVAAKDEAGAVGAPASATLTITVPAQPMIAGTADRQYVTLSWQDLKGSLPLARCEVYRQGVKRFDLPAASRGTTFPEPSAGQYTYEVCATDTAGNVGTRGTLVFDAPGAYITEDWIDGQIQEALASVPELDAIVDLTDFKEEAGAKIESITASLARGANLLPPMAGWLVSGGAIHPADPSAFRRDAHYAQITHPQGILDAPSVSLRPNTTYTLAFNGRSPAGATPSIFVDLYPDDLPQTSITLSGGGDAYSRYSWTFNSGASESLNNCRVRLFYPASEVHLWDVTLTEGAIALAWTPSDVVVVAAIKSVQQAVADETSARVEQYGSLSASLADKASNASLNAAVARLDTAETTLAGKASASAVEQVSARLDAGGDVQQAIVQVLSMAQATKDRTEGSFGAIIEAGGKLTGFRSHTDGTTSSFHIAAEQILMEPGNAIIDSDFKTFGTGLVWVGNWSSDQNADAWWGAHGARSYAFSSESAPNGDQSWLSSAYQRLPFAVGDDVRLTAFCMNTSNQTMYCVIQTSSTDAYEPQGGWHAVEVPPGATQSVALVFKVGANERYFRYLCGFSGAGARSGRGYMAVPRLVLAAGSSLMVDGSILTRHLSAEEIDAGKLRAREATIQHLQGQSLSYISADLGTVTSGLVRNSTGTTRLNLNETGSGEVFRLNGVTRIWGGGHVKWQTSLIHSSWSTTGFRFGNVETVYHYDDESPWYDTTWTQVEGSFTLDTGIPMGNIQGNAYEDHIYCTVSGYNIPAAARDYLVTRGLKIVASAVVAQPVPVANGGFGEENLQVIVTVRVAGIQPGDTASADVALLMNSVVVNIWK